MYCAMCVQRLPLSNPFMRQFEKRKLTTINEPLLRLKEIYMYSSFVEYI
jgi:hypothetical protein